MRLDRACQWRKVLIECRLLTRDSKEDDRDTMLIKEAMKVFWQSLKDTWEELYSIAIVNLVWLFSWALPLGLAFGTGIPAVIHTVRRSRCWPVRRQYGGASTM